MTTAADLIRLANECWLSRALHTVALLRVADALETSPTRVDDLADRVGADRHMIGTILKILARRGVFEVEDDWVTHTDASLLLRSGAEPGLADIVQWMGSEEVWNSLGKLPDVVTSGRSGFEMVHGQGLFKYLSENSARSKLFDRHMEGYTKREIKGVLNAIDLSPFRTIVDIGAGSGMLAVQIAERYPEARLTVFDLPGCSFSAVGEHPSIEKRHGNFFEDDLPAADLTILANVLHDWPDRDAMRILKAFGRTAQAGSCLCIVEGLSESGEEKVDMVNFGMAVMTGGRQRRLEQFEAMLVTLGYEIFEVRKCTEYVSVILARPLVGGPGTRPEPGLAR